MKKTRIQSTIIGVAAFLVLFGATVFFAHREHKDYDRVYKTIRQLQDNRVGGCVESLDSCENYKQPFCTGNWADRCDGDMLALHYLSTFRRNTDTDLSFIKSYLRENGYSVWNLESEVVAMTRWIRSHPKGLTYSKKEMTHYIAAGNWVVRGQNYSNIRELCLGETLFNIKK